MCSVYSWNERTEKSRENIYIGLCLRIYIQNSGRKHLFSFSEFFFSILVLYWIAYWYPIVVNVLLHVFVFGCMFFFSSFVVRYIFSQYRKSASKFFFVYVFLCENQGCLEANTLKLNTYVKKEYQSCKHGKYAQQSEHYGKRILEFIEFWLQTE